MAQNTELYMKASLTRKVFLPFSLFWVVITAGFLVTFDMVPQ